MVGDISFLKNKTVLFAEDDFIMKEQVKEILEMLFKKVYCEDNGVSAYDTYLEDKPDIIITDIKMPHMDGLNLVEEIRKNDYETPIIMITSFNEQELLLNATNLSIDGYIIKPINLNSLVRTITKSMQRSNKNKGLIHLRHNIYYNFSTQELYQNGEIVVLGYKEVELVKLLIANYPKTVSKENISQSLWPYESTCESAIKNLVLRIRKKINSDIIVSVRGIGYRLEDVMQD
ncbi:MAG: response regulator transcription factor [Arcobacteraceae bacterium]|nr:response regulator transcription factor [Arcobacteraceae bacterium]MDY0327235.1 response regulator transcription factor [Arcobacteraceae bacterium]